MRGLGARFQDVQIWEVPEPLIVGGYLFLPVGEFLAKKGFFRGALLRHNVDRREEWALDIADGC